MSRETPHLESEKHGLEYSHIDSPMKDSEGNHHVAPLQDDDFGFSQAEQRSIIRRIDRRLVITVGAMYCVSLMDRTNMSAANIAGMSVELNLINNRYVSLYHLFASINPLKKRRRKRLHGSLCETSSRTLPTSSSLPPTSSSNRPRLSSSAKSAPGCTWPL